MATGYAIKNNHYFDSVFLMQIASRLSEEPGIEQVAALMGTENNKGLLAEIGFEDAEILAADANDLILALIGESKSSVNDILENLDDWLTRKPSKVDKSEKRTLNDAITSLTNSNLAVISLPGEYVAKEAQNALEIGLNVFIFSSNVPVEDELFLKEEARERGLIVMGPDAGTSILAGAGIGFANVVRKGPIGVIGSTGTGIQEFTSLVHQSGAGISHAIGTGSRDLSDTIGGISTIIALEALEADPQTEIITLLSKPPGDKTISLIVERLNHSSKPVITCFLGLDKFPAGLDNSFSTANYLDKAAELAARAVIEKPNLDHSLDSKKIDAFITKEKEGKSPKQKYIRGLFAGGTFTYQAQQVMRDAGLAVYSNAPLDGMKQLTDPYRSEAHTLIDMGDELFTTGRPHPMIDSTLRRERILQEAKDPQVAVILLDFILGYNSSPDPVGDLSGAIGKAKQMVSQRGDTLSVVASVTGTELDPQNLEMQVAALEEKGVLVLPTSAQAALFTRSLALSLDS